jgi:hypothetical protein
VLHALMYAGGGIYRSDLYLQAFFIALCCAHVLMICASNYTHQLTHCCSIHIYLKIGRCHAQVSSRRDTGELVSLNLALIACMLDALAERVEKK